MTIRGFSVQAALAQYAASIQPQMPPSGKRAYDKVSVSLAAVEEQAIAIVGIVKQNPFLTVEGFKRILKEKNVGVVEIPMLAAFLAGYLSAESFDSRMDVALFGSMTVSDGKDIHVERALAALVATTALSGKMSMQSQPLIISGSDSGEPEDDDGDDGDDI